MSETENQPPPRSTGARAVVQPRHGFYGPDGVVYQAAWGRVRTAHSAELFGRSQGPSYEDWVVVGEGDGSVTFPWTYVLSVVACQAAPPSVAVYVAPPDVRDGPGRHCRAA